MQEHSVKFMKIGVQSFLFPLTEDSKREEISSNNFVLSIPQEDSAVKKDGTEETAAEASMYIMYIDASAHNDCEGETLWSGCCKSSLCTRCCSI